jgi:hypothetical protein
MHIEARERLDFVEIYSAISLLAEVILESEIGPTAYATVPREIARDFVLKSDAFTRRASHIRPMDKACAAQFS